VIVKVAVSLSTKLEDDGVDETTGEATGDSGTEDNVVGRPYTTGSNIDEVGTAFAVSLLVEDIGADGMVVEAREGTV
jgi:hypothetical protein